MTPFKFSIKLAAHASRKEHINLEKWLSENMNAYKDAFFEVISCASFCLHSRNELMIDAFFFFLKHV